MNGASALKKKEKKKKKKKLFYCCDNDISLFSSLGVQRGRLSQGRPQTPDDGRVLNVRSSHDSDLRDTLDSIDGA